MKSPEFYYENNGNKKLSLEHPQSNLHTSHTFDATKQQLLLVEIWSEVLSKPINDISIDANFFEMGGHSSLAEQVILRINKTFLVDLNIHAIFESPTIKKLAEKIFKSPTAAHEFPILVHAKESHPQPLSRNQMRIWFMNEFYGTSATCNIVMAWKLDGDLNREFLERAISDLITRQGVFRTIFLSANGKLKQILQPNNIGNFNLEFEELYNQSSEEINNYLKLLAAKPFRLEYERLYQFKLIKISNNSHIIFISLHPLIGDEQSIDILYRELSSLYHAYYYQEATTLTPLPAQYIDFCTWQQLAYSHETFRKQIAYWRSQLASLKPLELPTDYPRPATQTYCGDSINFTISPKITLLLREFSQKTKVNLSVLTLASFAILLAKYARKDDIAIGVPIAGRNFQAFENIIGSFVNTVVIRFGFTQNITIAELLQKSMATVLDAYANGNVPFEKLIDVLHPERDQSQNPLIQVMFAYNNAATESLKFPDIISQPLKINNNFTQLELSCILEEKSEIIEGRIEYNIDLFAKETMQRIINNYLKLLENISQYENEFVNKFCILSELEKKQLLSWNYKNEYYPQKSLTSLFEEKARIFPEKIAISYNNKMVTYRELNNQANQLANYINKKDSSTNPYIAVYFERSIETIIAFFAIMKTGKAYVPIDKEAPLSQIENIIDDSKVSIILTKREFFDTAIKLSARANTSVITIDEQQEMIANESTDNLEPYSSNALAYVIYTSGSTGKPKGVKIAHSSLVNLVFSMSKEIDFSENDRLLAITPFTFDLSVPDIYLPLILGGEFVLVDQSTRFNPQEIAFVMLERKITVMQATPTTWQMLINSKWKNEGRVKMICGGENLNIQLATQLLNTGAPLWNFYGPTETTVWASCYKVNIGDKVSTSVPIGKPLSNIQFLVLDANMQLTPIGVPGELYIGGDCVADGYLNNVQLTDERFIQNPFSTNPNNRLYKTGDIVFWSSSQELQYIGREDSQVKIRGHRVETEAIENFLNRYQDITESIVLDKSPTGEHELVAYLILRNNSVSSFDIRNYLSLHLPTYMIPTKYVVIDKFPLTFSGKIDRKALQSIDNFHYLSNLTAIDSSAQNEHEHVIIDIVKKLLHLAEVDPTTNFFELGAHSLLLVELAYALSKAFKKEVKIVEIFAYPSVRLLATYLGRNVHFEAANDYTKQRADAKRSRISNINKRARHAG